MSEPLKCFIAGILLAAALPAPLFAADAPTRFDDAPVRPDGTRDYAAALNQMMSQGVTNENNAFVPLLMVSESYEWPDAYYAAVVKALDLERPGAEVPQLVLYNHFLTTRTPDEEATARPQYEQALSGPWPATKYPFVDQWLALNEPALVIVREGMMRPRFHAPILVNGPDQKILDALLPELSLERQVTRMLDIRAYRAIHDGDLDGAWQDCLTLKRLARHASDQPTLIGALIGLSIDASGHHVFKSIVADKRLTAAQIRRMTAERATLPTPRDMAYAMDIGERALGLDFAQQWPTHATEMDGADQNTVQLVRSHALDKSRAHDRINNIFDRIHEAAAKPDWAQRTAAMDDLANELRRSHQRIEPLRAQLDEAGKDKPIAPDLRNQVTDVAVDSLMHLSVSSFNRSFKSEVMLTAMRQLETIALALRLYQSQHQSYPDTLNALAPECLPAVPVNPFTGRSVVYRLTDDSVLIYSVGADGVDDGGREKNDDGSLNDLVMHLPR